MRWPLRNVLQHQYYHPVFLLPMVGALFCWLRKTGSACFEYTPIQVKQAVAGYGKADKKQVMLMTQRLLQVNRIPGRTMRRMLWLLPSVTAARPPPC